MSFFGFKYSPPKSPVDSRRKLSNARSPIIPFCTSPSQLNEVSTCPDYTFTNCTLRSPEGATRGGGRSIKEFEEQLSQYKKENFNLKLRIYFLEERMGANFNLEKEKIVKNNVELMVENQSLKKELQEKHELLCQAVKAMDLEDEEFNKRAREKNEEIAALKQEIEDLKLQLNDGKFDNESCNKSYHSEPIYFNSVPESSSRFRALHEKISALEEELAAEKHNSASLQILIDSAETASKKYENLLAECGKKDEQIRVLREDGEMFKEKLSRVSHQMSDLEKSRERANLEIANLNKSLAEKTRLNYEMEEQFLDIKRRYGSLKAEFEREREKYDRTRIVSEIKIGELEDELKRQKSRVAELQKKLSALQAELKENQNLLVVPKSPDHGRFLMNTDDDRTVSVSNPTTPTRIQKEDALRDALSYDSTAPSKSPVQRTSFDFGFIEQTLNSIQFSEKSQVMNCLEQLREALEKYERKIVALKGQELKACALIKSLILGRKKADEKVKGLNERVGQLEKELEGVVSKPVEKPCAQTSQELQDANEALVRELETKIQILELTLKEKDVHLKYIEEQNRDLQNNLQSKEKEMLSISSKIVENPEAENAGNSSEGTYSIVLDEKNKEIEKLNEELRKRTYDLQAVVNKELWQKNREIEKLQLKYTQLLSDKEKEMIELKKSFSTLSENLEEFRSENEEKHNENSKLKIENSDLKLQLQLLRDKISEIGLISDDKLEVEIIINSLDDVKNIQTELELIKSEKEILTRKIDELNQAVNNAELDDSTDDELRKLRQKFETSEALRAQTNRVCIILRNQLEELAVFLDSLMKQKSVLGFLGNSQNKRLREAIDHSLDLSKSLNVTLNNLNLDQSLMQLSNITDLLNSTNEQSNFEESNRYSFSLVPEQAKLIYENNLKINEETDEHRSFYVKSLEDQVEMLQNELKSKTIELDQFKHSESWSEPDTNVSKARIGLFIEENDRELVGVEELHSDSTDESLTSLNKRRSDILSECQTTITKLNRQVVELQSKLQEKNGLFEIVQQDNASLKSEICAVRTARSDLEREFGELKIKLDELEKEKVELESNYDAAEREIRRTRFERDELVNLTKDYANMAVNSRQDVVELEKKLIEISFEKETVENTFARIIAEKDVELEKIEADSHAKISELSEKITELLEDYTENYVKKSQLDAEIQQVQTLKSQLEQVKQSLEASKTNEKMLKNQLNNVQAALNEVDTQQSEISREKSRLEQEMSGLLKSKSDLELQLAEAQQEISSLKECYHKEVNLLQSYKSKLELKLSELEFQNAELQNKFVKLTIGSSANEFYGSLPAQIEDSNRSKSLMRQISSGAQSFVSEDDVRTNHRGPFSIVVPQKNAESERIEANSSPDLGIESDQGRFSSLEAVQNQQQHVRPLLQTIEITGSINNLLDGDNNSIQSFTCGNKTCYQKIVELWQENSSLKKKLMKTRRMFEDTAIQLATANQRKKQIEKNICKQITKTSQVLREAKANLDSGSETDFHRK